MKKYNKNPIIDKTINQFLFILKETVVELIVCDLKV
ncbi:hypothetical protein SAMN05216234_10152 [Hydrogenimonas thermophila]|uniref:Uncharacterized protein n=1 Tax=Hydrogenimonas thermophila TaxID=223786 RepID=A0A1I5KRJ5_9BACT|nr:hypothetical protein SAMN05216234_10152 [Hydrogenimonas thermophila]